MRRMRECELKNSNQNAAEQGTSRARVGADLSPGGAAAAAISDIELLERRTVEGATANGGQDKGSDGSMSDVPVI